MASPKTIALTFVKVVVPLAIIAALLWHVEPEKWEALQARPIRWGVMAGALVVALLAVLMSFVRWWLLVRCLGISLGLIEALRLSSICFLLSFVSAGSVGGDLFKAVFLVRRSRQPIAAVASVIVDRGAGMYGLLVLVAIGLMLRTSTDAFAFSGISIDDFRRVTLTLLIVGTVLLAVLVLGGKVIDTVIGRASQWPLVGGMIHKIGPPLRMFHDHPVAFFASIVLSVLTQGFLVLSLFLIADSMYENPPTLAEHFLIVPIGMLASALPITPAGIGVLEATIEALYRVVPANVTDASGTLVALVFELVKLVLAAIGMVFYWTASGEEAASLQYLQEHADEEIEDLASDLPNVEKAPSE